MPEPGLNQKLLDSHEERLMRLESSYPEMVEGLAVSAAGVEAVGVKVEGVESKVDTVIKLVEGVHEAIQGHGKRVEAVETWQKGVVSAQERRSRALRKVALALLVAAAGGLGKTVWDLVMKAI